MHVVGRLSAAIGKRQRRPGVDLVREGVGHAPPARAGALRVAGRARASAAAASDVELGMHIPHAIAAMTPRLSERRVNQIVIGGSQLGRVHARRGACGSGALQRARVMVLGESSRARTVPTAPGINLARAAV